MKSPYTDSLAHITFELNNRKDVEIICPDHIHMYVKVYHQNLECYYL